MRRVHVLAFLFGIALAWGAKAAIASAAENFDAPAPMQEWLKATQSQGALQPGTTITSTNWQQYKQFMPYGMQTLFAGKYF
jgi:Spy/CpxP family protein refolding chaperone